MLLRTLVIKVYGQLMESHGMCFRNSIYNSQNTHFPKEEQCLFEEVCYNIARICCSQIQGKMHNLSASNAFQHRIVNYEFLHTCFQAKLLPLTEKRPSNGLGASIWVVCERAKSHLRTICQLGNVFSSRRSS
jgi:hypothetical protein